MRDIIKNSSHSSFFSWICWGLVASLYLVQYGLLVFPSVILDQLQQSLGIDSTDIGILSSAFLYVYVLFQIPVGLIFDRFNTRRVILLATFLLIIGCLLMAFSTNYSTVILARILMGFGGSFMFVGALYLGRIGFAAVMFPLIVGLTEAMSSLGSLSLISMFTLMTKFQSYQMILIEIALLLIILGILVFFFLNKQHKSTAQKIDYRKQLGYVLRRGRIWLLGVYIALFFAHFSVMTNMWAIPLLETTYHLSSIDAVFENAFTLIGFTLGTIMIGYFARFMLEEKIMMICAIIQFACLSGIFFFHSNMVMHAVIFFTAGFVTGAVVLCFDLVKKLVPAEAHGTASGFLNMFFGGVGIFLIPFIGYLLQHTHNRFHLATIPIIIFSFLAVIIAYVLLLTYPKNKLQ